MCVHVYVGTHMYTGMYYGRSCVFGGWHSVFLSYSPMRQGHSLNPELCSSVTLAGCLVSGKPPFHRQTSRILWELLLPSVLPFRTQSPRLHRERLTQGVVFFAWFESLYRFLQPHPFRLSTLLLTMVSFILSFIELWKLEIRTLKGHKIEICMFYLKEISIRC